MNITKVMSFEILDSRGYPTLKTFIELENGIKAAASVPSGASTGSYEALELRDNDMRRYAGKGVSKAVANVNEILAKNICGLPIEDLSAIDKKLIELDNTHNKSNYGANSILSVSLAAARLLAKYQNQPLWKTLLTYYFPNNKPSFPRLMVNIINGGKHANWSFDIQEFMIVPHMTTPSESVRVASEIFHSLEALLKENGLSTLVGDEGGFAPQLTSNDKVFNYILQAITNSHYDKTVVELAIDAAASEFYQNGTYFFRKEGKQFTGDQLIVYYETLLKKYQIMSFEDIFSEDDWENFRKFTEKVGNHALVVGDDLYTTNPLRIQKGIDEKTTNAIIIKPNQIGTLSETVSALKMSQKAGFKTIISHRSGETEDTFISDLAVASMADFIKTGSMSRSERLAKYNRLIEIEKLEL